MANFSDEELTESMNKYAGTYDDSKFWTIIRKYGKKIGGGLLTKALQLYYLLQKGDVPNKIKLMIMGALAYLVSPVDLIPDLIPLLGWTDDAAAVGLVVNQLSNYIDSDIVDMARKKIEEIFG